MRYVAFLRAVNVGGHGTVRMADVRTAFSQAGCRRVETYIQSGNVVFDLPARELPATLGRASSRLSRLLDDEPHLMVRTIGEIESVVSQSPFEQVSADPDAKLYVAFLAGNARLAPAFRVQSTTEALDVFGVGGRDVVIVSRRKRNGSFGFPNAFVEKTIGVPATSRNWSTVSKIAAFAKQV